MKRACRLQKTAAHAALALAALLFGAFAAAQTLPDPTRPPAGFVDPADLKAGAAAGGINGGAHGDDPATPGLVLQSVLLPEQGRPVAVISGHYLPLGAKLGQWELMAVNERQVVLQQGGERRVLQLTPQVTKTMARSPAPAKPAERAGDRTNSKRPMPRKAS